MLTYFWGTRAYFIGGWKLRFIGGRAPARGSSGLGKNSLGPFLSIFLSFSNRLSVPVAKPGFFVKALAQL